MKNRTLDRMKQDMQVVKLEIEKSVNNGADMEYIQKMINLQQIIGEKIVAEMNKA